MPLDPNEEISQTPDVVIVADTSIKDVDGYPDTWDLERLKTKYGYEEAWVFYAALGQTLLGVATGAVVVSANVVVDEAGATWLEDELRPRITGDGPYIVE